MAARRCPICNEYIDNLDRWTTCQNCGYVLHCKIKNNGRLRKVIPHPPSEVVIINNNKTEEEK
jgi:hypothetical protein